MIYELSCVIREDALHATIDSVQYRSSFVLRLPPPHRVKRHRKGDRQTDRQTDRKRERERERERELRDPKC